MGAGGGLGGGVHVRAGVKSANIESLDAAAHAEEIT